MTVLAPSRELSVSKETLEVFATARNTDVEPTCSGYAMSMTPAVGAVPRSRVTLKTL